MPTATDNYLYTLIYFVQVFIELFLYMSDYCFMNTMKKEPPWLKPEKRKPMTVLVTDEIRELLRKAKNATGLNMSEYVERALNTQFKIDYIE